MGQNLHSVLFLLIIIALLVNIKGSFGQNRASFGEPCDKTTRCDSRANLACTNGTCQCVKGEEMTFDKDREKCLVLSGERCSYTAIEVLMDIAKEKRWTEKLDCVENAMCKEDGYCGCKNEFFENFEGFCVSKRSFGGNCTRDSECREDKHLTCEDRVCVCNKTESVWDFGYGQCLAKVGASCMKYGMCVRNAFCPRTRGYCCAGRENRDICQCSADYKKSKEGLCLGSYDVYCDSVSSPCSEDLTCINNKCSCHFPQHQVYNRTLGVCVSYVRGPCSEMRNGVEFQYRCVEKAECRKDHNQGIPECTCKEGFIESDNRQCLLSFGSKCKYNDVCDKLANLICENGKCSCRDLQVYNHAASKCKGLVGAVCNVTDHEFCVDGAFCQSYRDERSGNGVCRCKAAYQAVPAERKCVHVTADTIKRKDAEESETGTSTTPLYLADENTTEQIRINSN